MNLLVIVIVSCGVWAVVASILIARDLQNRGEPVSFFWLRVMILQYLADYNRITTAETGRVGPLFYHYVVPLNLALALAIVLALTSL